MIKKLLTNTPFFIVISLVVLIVSIFLDLRCDDSNFFQRTGSLVAGFGAIVLVRKQISMTYKDVIKDEYTTDGGTFDTDYSQVHKEAQKNVNAIYIGTILIVVGSLISGYGDYLISLI